MNNSNLTPFHNRDGAPVLRIDEVGIKAAQVEIRGFHRGVRLEYAGLTTDRELSALIQAKARRPKRSWRNR